MPMKAGIDFGLSNVKAYWINGEDHEIFHSTSDWSDADLAYGSRERLAEIMALNGVTELHATGIGPRDSFERFTIIEPHPKTDPIFGELSTQARGAVWLTEGPDWTWKSVRRMFVSIGTGTSYLFEDTNDETYGTPIGNPLGAGSIDGHKSLFGYARNAPIDQLLGDAMPPPNFDLTLGEAVPSIRGTIKEHFVASHFVKASRLPANVEHEGYDRKWIASAVNEVLVAITRDLMNCEDNPKWSGFKDVVVLGALPHKSKIFRDLLTLYLGLIGKNPIFPPRGEYAGAVGARHRHA